MDDPFDTPAFREAAAGHQQDQERGRVVPIPIPRGGIISPELGRRAAELKEMLRPLDSIRPVLASRYLVKGWIDRGVLSVVFGESNVGKTFFALDLAMHVAAGEDWHGARVPSGAGSVVYIAGEGGAGIMNRIEALRRERSHLTGGGDSFQLLPTVLDVHGAGDAEALLKAIECLPRPPALIVIDTLARAFGSGDENATKDMGAFIGNVDVIRAGTGAHVMVIHHSGKDRAKGARGSVSLRAAADTEVELTSDGTLIVAATKKQRDIASGAVFAYTLRSVLIGHDEDGDAVTSAVVEEADAPAKRAPQLKGQALIAMQAFSDAVADHGEVRAGEAFPSNRQCVSLDRWREYCDRHSLTDGTSDSAARTAFGRAWKGLQEKQVIRVLYGYAWRCSDE